MEFKSINKDTDIVFGKSQGSRRHAAQKIFHDIIERSVSINSINHTGKRDDNWLKKIQNEIRSKIQNYRFMEYNRFKNHFILIPRDKEHNKIWERIKAKKYHLNDRIKKESGVIVTEDGTKIDRMYSDFVNYKRWKMSKTRFEDLSNIPSHDIALFEEYFQYCEWKLMKQYNKDKSKLSPNQNHQHMKSKKHLISTKHSTVLSHKRRDVDQEQDTDDNESQDDNSDEQNKNNKDRKCKKRRTYNEIEEEISVSDDEINVQHNVDGFICNRNNDLGIQSYEQMNLSTKEHEDDSLQSEQDEEGSVEKYEIKDNITPSPGKRNDGSDSSVQITHSQLFLDKTGKDAVPMNNNFNNGLGVASIPAINNKHNNMDDVEIDNLSENESLPEEPDQKEQEQENQQNEEQCDDGYSVFSTRKSMPKRLNEYHDRLQIANEQRKDKLIGACILDRFKRSHLFFKNVHPNGNYVKEFAPMDKNNNVSIYTSWNLTSFKSKMGRLKEAGVPGDGNCAVASFLACYNDEHGTNYCVKDDTIGKMRKYFSYGYMVTLLDESIQEWGGEDMSVDKIDKSQYRFTQLLLNGNKPFTKWYEKEKEKEYAKMNDEVLDETYWYETECHFVFMSYLLKKSFVIFQKNIGQKGQFLKSGTYAYIRYDKRYPHMMPVIVYNGIIGGSSTTKLFINPKDTYFFVHDTNKHYDALVQSSKTVKNIRETPDSIEQPYDVIKEGDRFFVSDDSFYSVQSDFEKLLDYLSFD